MSYDYFPAKKEWLASIIEVGQYKLALGRITGRLSSIKEAPDTVIFPVHQETGEVTPVSVWMNGTRKSTNDHDVMAASAVRQLANLFKSSEMMGVFGPLGFHSQDGEGKMHARFKTIFTHGFRDPAIYRDNCTYNALGSRPIMGPDGEPIAGKVGAAIELRDRLTTIEIEPEGSSDSWVMYSGLKGTVTFFGIPSRFRVDHPLLRMDRAVEMVDVVPSIISIFNKYYSFLYNAETFRDWKQVERSSVNQIAGEQDSVMRSVTQLLNKLERNLNNK